MRDGIYTAQIKSHSFILHNNGKLDLVVTLEYTQNDDAIDGTEQVLIAFDLNAASGNKERNCGALITALLKAANCDATEKLPGKTINLRLTDNDISAVYCQGLNDILIDLS